MASTETAPATDATSRPSFTYAAFGDWYDSYRARTLEPALAVATASLQAELNDLLSDRDLARIRNIAGRVKSKRRTWRKLRQPRYRTQITKVADIPSVIDDLIGLRITCTNLRDLEMVQAALDVLPRRPRTNRPIGLDPASERDYVEAPKDSGYRGWHVNLAVIHDGVAVTCELQIRTLLQDSWGELTHEDTYSKAGELPPLVEVLSKRMADLLATLDDIAEDLRNELDRIDEAVVGEIGDVAATDVDTRGDTSMDDQAASGIAADAADLLLERWRSLDRPIELATLAWALQKEFGAEVSDDWFGHGTFKRFLRDVVPDGEISTGRHAYLLPAEDRSTAAAAESDAVDVADGSEPADDRSEAPAAAPSIADDSIVPDEARQLRRIDRGFPLIESEQWSQIFGQLAAAWRRIGTHAPNTRLVNQLTRSARDRAGAAGEPISRRHLDYVAKAVLSSTESGEPLTTEQIAEAFASTTLQRMSDLRILDESNATRRAAVARWLLR